MKLRAATTLDGYKVKHGMMYSNGTESVYSNFTPRSNEIYLRNCTSFYDGKLVFIGAQGAVQEVQELWDDSFFQLSKEKAVGRFVKRMASYLGGAAQATAALEELHDLGFLPLLIKALPEGTRVPMGVPVLTITNTLPPFFWLVNYLETLLSDLLWKQSTNATIAAEYKAICQYYANITGTDDFTVSIQCHDFSMRGMSGPEDAARSGFPHLTQFIGTDTLPAMDYAEDYYGMEGEFIAMSVSATEHAVATSNILRIEGVMSYDFTDNRPGLRLQAEHLFMLELITEKFPTGIISYVADSFDFWSVLTNILPNIKTQIMAREANGLEPGKLVIRPDSGDPVQVVCGTIDGAFDTLATAIVEINGQHFEEAREGCEGSYCQGNDSYTSLVYVKEDAKYYELTTTFDYNRHDKQYYYIDNYNDGAGDTLAVEVSPTAEQKGAVQVLWEIFGGTETATGYKLLDSHIGLIYGDSITTKRAEEILGRLEQKGFASGNVVFGVGSYTYQCNTRDTFGFAMKATHTVVDGVAIDVFKEPKTDSGKKSHKGLLRVDRVNGELVTQSNCTPDEETGGLLELLWKDGRFERRVTLADIRNRLA
jgi:nicotinamide phosphoribosyltransferase